MIYPYMSILAYNTEVTYGKSYTLRGVRCIDVFVERATKDSLINVMVQMPFCKIKESSGMSDQEIAYWVDFIKRNYSLIQEFSIREEAKIKKQHKRHN